MPVSLRRDGDPPPELQLVIHTCGGSVGGFCNCHAIERVGEHKYLGVIFDSRLRWDRHICLLKGRLRKLIFAFYQLSPILTVNEFKKAYFAYVQSVMQYGIIAWGGAYKSHQTALSTTQKTIIKTGLRKDRRYPSEMLFKETNILCIRKLFIKTLALHIFLRKPLLFNRTHTYDTRNPQYLQGMPSLVKSVNTTNSFYLQHILYRGMPDYLRFPRSSLQTYKKALDQWLAGIEEKSKERVE